MSMFFNSVDEYLNEIYRIQKKIKEDEILIFRGLSKASYQLTPTVFRLNKKVDTEKMQFEQMSVEFPDEFDRKNHLSYLVKMQHFGADTRILDFTRNPLIALYFAVCDCGVDSEPCVKYIIVPKKEILSHYSDKVLMLSCLACFDDQDKEKLRRLCQSHKDSKGLLFTKNSVYERYLHEIRREFPAFEDAIVGKDLLGYQFVAPNKDNVRMKSQDGLFCIFGLDDHKNQQDLDAKAKTLFVNRNSCLEILKQLQLLNIDQYHIYPGIEEFAYIKKNRLKKWENVK